MPFCLNIFIVIVGSVSNFLLLVIASNQKIVVGEIDLQTITQVNGSSSERLSTSQCTSGGGFRQHDRSTSETACSIISNNARVERTTARRNILKSEKIDCSSVIDGHFRSSTIHVGGSSVASITGSRDARGNVGDFLVFIFYFFGRQLCGVSKNEKRRRKTGRGCVSFCFFFSKRKISLGIELGCLDRCSDTGRVDVL